MPDREKVEHVINAFERVIEVFDGRISGPYFEAWMCATKDALALLKAQEPVEPKKKSFLVSGQGDYTSTPAMTVCGACDAWLLTVEPRAKYCPQCGRAVKWE